MCAEVYHCAGFIASDPVQFPHRYTLKQDIEIFLPGQPIVFIGCCRMLIFMDTSVGYIRPIRSSEVWKML